MSCKARSAFLLLIIGFNCASLSADAAKDAWKRCKKAGRNEKETRLRECSAAIESGTLSNQESSEAHIIRASAHVARGDYDLAIKDADESVRLTPSATWSFVTRGWAYLGKYEYKRAIEDFDRAIQIGRKDSYAYANRGIAKFLLGDFAAAEKDFDENERLSPKIARGYSDLDRLVAHMRDAKGKPTGPPLKLGASDLTQWPGQIIGYYEGDGTEDTVLTAAARFPNERKWKLCQAYFFFAERALMDGNREKAMQLLQMSLDTDAKEDVEYVLARGELHNLQSAENKESASSQSEANQPAQASATKATAEARANQNGAAAVPAKDIEQHVPDLAAIHPGSSTRDEIRGDWVCCDAHVVSNRIFVAEKRSERGEIKYLLVEFDDKGVVSSSHMVSPDDLLGAAVDWARKTPEPLDLSNPVQLKPAIVCFAGWRVHYFSGPIELHAGGFHLGGKGGGLELKSGQLGRFRQCGAMKVSLHHTCTGFGAFGVDVDAEHPGTQIDVSGLPEIGSHLHILMNVPDLFTFVRYLRQTAPSALGGSTEN